MRVAVVDIGTNSTRLLVADVRDGGVEELDRRSVVTRLGEDVDATGRLADAAQERVFERLAEYAESIERHDCERRLAVLTSAVRDADNGAAFAGAVRERFGLDARTLSGDEEARLTYLGATAARDARRGGRCWWSTSAAARPSSSRARAGEMDFHVSTQAGVVRHTERFLRDDPPAREDVDALARDVRAVFEEAVPAAVRERVRAAVAVAGTATSVAAIDAGIEPYDPARVEGAVVRAFRLAEISATLVGAPARGAKGRAGSAPGPGAHHRGRDDPPGPGAGGVRARSLRGFGTGHPVGRGDRRRT